MMSFIRLDATRHGELRGTAAIAAVATMIAELFAGSTIVTPLYVIYQRELGFSHTTLTLVYATYAIGNMIALLVFGRVADRIGGRRTALPALVVGIASALVFLFAAHVISLYVGRILSGLSTGVGAGTGTAWQAELVEEKDRTQTATIATAANFLELAFGALISGLLAQFAPRPLRLSFIIYLGARRVVAPSQQPSWRLLWWRFSSVFGTCATGDTSSGNRVAWTSLTLKSAD